VNLSRGYQGASSAPIMPNSWRLHFRSGWGDRSYPMPNLPQFRHIGRGGGA
jgi:hypothetical protein